MKKLASLMVTVLAFTVGALGQNTGYVSEKVADGVYSFGGGPYAYYSMFVVTNEGVIVADPINADLASSMMNEIREITDKPIKYLIYSHNHWDHISGGKIFKDAGATVVSHSETKEHLIPNPNVVMPDQTWTGDRFDIRLGGKTVELYYYGANHGSGMTVFYLPDEKILFTADLVVPKRVAFMFMPDFSPQNWIRSLKEIEKLEFETALFGHDIPTGTKKDVVLQREYLEDLTMAVGKAMQSGDMMLQSVSLPKYKDWAHYNDWLGMNAARIMLEMMMGY